MTNIIISGIAGKMGAMIADLAKKDPEINITGGIEKRGDPNYPSDLTSIIDKADVIIEFTSPEATLEHLGIAQRHKKAMVIGTTGFSEDQLKEIDRLSKGITCVISPNMSIGVNVVFEISAEISRRLGRNYDIEIVESHHKHKKDAPSGTAKKIADYITKASGRSSIPTHSVRAGEIVGEHTVIWAGPGEVIELTHRAQSRVIFANGSIVAAKFAAKAKPGIYNMIDVLKT